MDGVTHTYAGLAVGFSELAVMRFYPSFSAYLPVSPTSLTGIVCVVGAAVLGALAPDIDKTNSKISTTFPILKKTEHFFGHRGIVHSPLFWIAFLFIICKIFTNDIVICFSFMLGVCTHLLLDMLNRAGIPLLYPFVKKKIHIASISANSGSGKIVNRVFALLSTIACMLFLFFPVIEKSV